MKKLFHVKNRTLVAIAGCVWLAAGVNVARLGFIAYGQLEGTKILHILLSAAVFCAFGAMFARMTVKHTRRISSCPQPTQPVWCFFDIKAYVIMAVMMGGGI